MMIEMISKITLDLSLSLSQTKERTRNQELGQEEERGEKQRKWQFREEQHARQSERADRLDAGEGAEEEARVQEQEGEAGGARQAEEPLQRQPRCLGLPRHDTLGKVSGARRPKSACVMDRYTYRVSYQLVALGWVTFDLGVPSSYLTAQCRGHLQIPLPV